MSNAQLIRSVAGIGIAVFIVAMVAEPQEAVALAAPNAAARFAINVPSSVLAAAAPSGQSGAALASGQTFNWAYAESQFADAAKFTAPATKAAALTKVVGGTNVAVLGFSAGTMIGQGASRLFGFTDNQVCQQRNDSLTVVASVLDGVNCDAFQNAIAEVQRDADEVPVSSFDPVTVAGVTVTYVKGIPWPELAPDNLLTCFKWTGKLPTTARYQISVDVWGANNTSSSSGSPDTSNHYCGESEISNLSGWWIGAPLLRYQVNIWDYDSIAPTITSPVMIGTVAQPHPERHFECNILTTESHLYTAASEPFRETDATLPPVICPAIPPNEIAAHQNIGEVGGSTNYDLQNDDTTQAYRDWRTQHPDCNDGSCQLDLRHHGVSCFRTTDPAECDGWLENPAGYTCVYGTAPVDLTECNIYATVFTRTHQTDGTAYADPATGDAVANPTSPTTTDALTASLLERHWDVWQTPKYELGTGDEGAAARAIAAQCVALGVEDECVSTAIFSPGNDIKEAAQHDLDAIQGKGSTSNKQPALLRYSSPAERRSAKVSRSWYQFEANCAEPHDSKLTHCDEYPFYSTDGSGPGASIRLIPESQNSAEGLYLKHFYARCDLAGPVDDRKPFVVVPIIESRTTAWCAR
ncbi:hypothetical protein BH09ACT1_BH09ACT1_12090 [soil metagenome]